MVKEVKLAELKTPYDWRVHPDAQIERLIKSYQEHGYVAPIIVDRENNVLAGHARLRALQEAGIESVKVLEVDTSSEYVIADNLLFEVGSWAPEVIEHRVDQEIIENYAPPKIEVKTIWGDTSVDVEWLTLDPVVEEVRCRSCGKTWIRSGMSS